MAFFNLKNANKSRYGSILTGIDSQQSPDNFQLVKTANEIRKTLSNHTLILIYNRERNRATEGKR
jgi:hypothetical protein